MKLIVINFYKKTAKFKKFKTISNFFNKSIEEKKHYHNNYIVILIIFIFRFIKMTDVYSKIYDMSKALS
jgi:hypothetical protein